MKRLALLAALVSLVAADLWAQATPQKVTVFASHPLARFRVDGTEYVGSAAFFWVENSRHVLEFPRGDDGYQYLGGQNPAANTRFRFIGWADHSGVADLPATPILSLVVHSQMNLIEVRVQTEHRVRLNFWQNQAPPVAPADAVCDPAAANGAGVVFVNDTCYSQNTALWFEEGVIELEAHPYPGFAFLGWILNGGPPNSFLQEVFVNGAMTLYAVFRPGKRVKFLTDPMGFEVLVDRARVRTPTADPCPSEELLPPGPAPGATPMCLAEFDWVLGSRHVIGAPTPQLDATGAPWVFDSFSNGMGNHSIYEVTSTSGREVLVAHFVRGARVSFVTQPSGFKLSIDGRDNWLSYNFVVAPGKVFTVSAPSEQVDSDGRKWVFAGWSNGGDQTQEVTIPEDAVEHGYRLTARYELLSQLVVDTAPLHVPVEVDGATCETPCVIDRPDGTEVTVTAPAQHSINHAFRVEFHSWADGAERSRTVTVGGQEPIQLKANYVKKYLLEAKSVPADGADFTLKPVSEDGFYQDGTVVQVTADAKEGYRFRRWEGDLSGTYPAGQLKMDGPRRAIAMLDKVEVAPPAWVQNAAGPTPEDVVAPGSIISIYGSKLAPHLQIGPTNPLMQTLLGTTVMVDGRILALLFVSPEQINAVLHPDTPEGKQTVVISRPGELDITTEIEVRRNAPGLFTRVFEDRLFAMASHEDGSPVTPDSPARRGEVVTIYGTGFGPYDKIAPYGFPLPDSPAFSTVDPVELFAGDQLLEPQFVGGAPGFAGTDILRLPIGDDLPQASTVELKVRINGRESNTVLFPLE